MTNDADPVPEGNGARPRKVRLAAIAARAGVSISTVSRVLNGVPTISAPVRRRVLDCAASLGYRATPEPPPVGSVRHIGFFVTFPPASASLSPFYGDILDGVERECRTRGLHLSYTVLDRVENAPDALLARVAENRIDAGLFLSLDDRPLIAAVARGGLPAVIVNAEHPGSSLDTFVPDNHAGGYDATRHLIAQGHRRILHLTLLHRATFHQRLDGYKAALAEAGIPFDPSLVLETPLDTEAADEALRRRLATGRDFTAVFCTNDLAAIGALRALRAARLRVPEECSLVGYDDIPMAAYTDPPLTTMRVARRELGALALRRLVDRAADPVLTPIRVTLACRLIERASVAPPR